MLATLLLTLLTGVAAPQEKQAEGKGPAPAKLELLGGDETYRKIDVKESDLSGKLVKTAAGPFAMEVISFVPVTVQREVNGKNVTSAELVPVTKQEAIEAGGKGPALEPYVGKTIKMTGKVIKSAFWPARLELLDPRAKAPEEDGGCCVEEKETPLKIHAKARWPFASSNPDGDKQGKQFVVRSAAELVARSTIADAKGEGAEQKLTAEIAKLLNVESIDWKKQMLVVVTGGVKSSGGWKIDIAAVTKGEKTCTVSWSLEAPQGMATQAFTQPAIVALVERCDGEIAFLKSALPVKSPTSK